jgi:ATP-dependent exoDNAse (exonuclease V) alpha subunit
MNLNELARAAEEERELEEKELANAALEDRQLDEALEIRPDHVTVIDPDVLTFSDSDPVFRYICGTAGTGKTFAVRELAERDPRVALTATTGIAAVNLGGATINSMLQYFDTESMLELSTRLDNRIKKWARQDITHWVLDEASMLDGEQLRCLVLAIESVNKELSAGKTYDGSPVRLTLVGDFAQLPPVKAKFAFEVEEWDRFEPATTSLVDIKRQTDLDFIKALQAARVGNAKAALDYFRDFIVSNRDLDFPGTTIVAKNAQVDRHNAIKLSDHPGERRAFKKSFWGTQRPEWVRNIPEALELKLGATVMVLANQKRDQDLSGGSTDYLYVNGDIGKVVEYDTYGMRYRKGERPEEVPAVDVELDRTGETVSIAMVERQYEDLDEKGKKCIIGGIDYFPLRVAYATTVHKSQGLTLDHVQVSFSDHFFSSPGMLYVALSRVRTPKGLRLVGNPELFLRRCGTDDRVRRWL